MKAGEIAEKIGGILKGNAQAEVYALDDLKGERENALSFIGEPSYLKLLQQSRAKIILVEENLDIPKIEELFLTDGKACIVVKGAYLAFIKLIRIFYPESSDPLSRKNIPERLIADDAETGEGTIIYPNVFIDAKVKIGKNSVLYPGVVLMKGTSVGDECILYPNVVVYENSIIGNRVVIGGSTVIGSDGFGFIENNGKRIKIPHVGRVVIEDEVEIGSNTSIDRGTIGDTLIKSRTKIDNLVQVAHNCIIGEDCVLCGMVGLSGSTVLENGVIMAAGSGTKGHMTIGEKSVVTARTSVTKDLAPGSEVKGYPARPLSEELKIQMLLGKLPDIYERLKALEKERAK
jgi:UDP-3-O-[3-hydroxymyristoyl] glucosamine N-acyltransferase